MKRHTDSLSKELADLVLDWQKRGATRSDMITVMLATVSCIVPSRARRIAVRFLERAFEV